MLELKGQRKGAKEEKKRGKIKGVRNRFNSQRGQFQSYTDADGVAVNVTSTSNGNIAEMQRTASSNGNTVTESWLFSYLSSDNANAGLLSNVTLRTNVNGGAWSTVQQVAYTYYDGTQEYGGNLGDLMTATVEDGNNNVLSTSYYRYYTPGAANGYKHGLEYVFNPDSYLRMTAANPGISLGYLTDADVAPYADNYFQYDSQQRVSEEVAAGDGDSQTSGGLGTYTFSYTASTNTPYVNYWSTKTVVTNPDGSTDTVYTNYIGEVMLDDHHDLVSGSDTDEFYVYNSLGQLSLAADASAITGYSDTYADLLHYQSGGYQDLSPSSGLITHYEYYTATDATDTTAGYIVNYLQEEFIKQGQQGAPVYEQYWTYYAHAFNGQNIAAVAAYSVFRNDNDTGTETTSYTYYPGMNVAY